ncbi:hypothetical protein GIB67_029937 [Kingdonia uniflora]|uniref:Uncharacterized protein n=1 Tax=Kingdonia uniflora TaxID=39325 RepID=A0A7J7MXK4_9MAGN|nr:hypothetical protein GIB67_029937 [Kingdonia uniflora]
MDPNHSIAIKLSKSAKWVAWSCFEKCGTRCLAEDPSSSKDGIKKKSDGAGSSTGLRVVLIFLGLAAIVVLSVFLFKIWQKKKREEQHARLLRLFEEDDELELELGLRE